MFRPDHVLSTVRMFRPDRVLCALGHGDLAWPLSWELRGDVETWPGLSTEKLHASVRMSVLRRLGSGAEVGLSG